MGGGSSSSTESKQQTTNTQKDTTATGGGIAVGSEGQLYALDQSTALDIGVGASGTILSLGDGASAVLQQMDKNTADVLLSSVAVLGNNANNFMSLAAGRSPDLQLADTTTETLANARANPFLTFVQTNAGRIALVALVGLIIVPALIFRRSGRRGK